MGQPIRTPVTEYGTDCPACTIPFGATWFPDHTPKYIFCKFWDITTCGFGHHTAPNDRIFRLEQHPLNHCHWLHNGSAWHINYFATLIAPPNSQLRLADHDGWSYFTALRRKCTGEYQVWNNAQAACILMYAGAGGHAMIWWNSDLLDLAYDIVIPPRVDRFYDPFSAGGLQNVHRYASRYERTNIKIKQFNF